MRQIEKQDVDVLRQTFIVMFEEFLHALKEKTVSMEKVTNIRNSLVELLLQHVDNERYLKYVGLTALGSFIFTNPTGRGMLSHISLRTIDYLFQGECDLRPMLRIKQLYSIPVEDFLLNMREMIVAFLFSLIDPEKYEDYSEEQLAQSWQMIQKMPQGVEITERCMWLHFMLTDIFDIPGEMPTEIIERYNELRYRM